MDLHRKTLDFSKAFLQISQWEAAESAASLLVFQNEPPPLLRAVPPEEEELLLCFLVRVTLR